MGRIKEFKKRGPKRNNPIHHKPSIEKISTPVQTEGRCVKCGIKAELGDMLCLSCWYKTTDAALIILVDKRYSKR